MLAVRIHRDDALPGAAHHVLEGGPECPPLAEVTQVADDRRALLRGRARGAVPGPVIDDEDVVALPAQRAGQLPDGARAVERRDRDHVAPP
jgi:hypothetical protein